MKIFLYLSYCMDMFNAMGVSDLTPDMSDKIQRNSVPQSPI
jgi:hypothetical protein